MHLRAPAWVTSMQLANVRTDVLLDAAVSSVSQRLSTMTSARLSRTVFEMYVHSQASPNSILIKT
jgi:hypothetical protein